MVQGEFTGLVLATDRKARTGDFVVAAHSTRQPAYEGRLAATDITYQFNNFTATQLTAELLGELLGIAGTGRGDLPCRDGTHMLRIVARAVRQ